MGVSATNIKVGTALPPLVKQLTMEQMLLFSSGTGRVDKVNLHTDAAAAQRDTGMKKPFASGRISMGYASASMSSAAPARSISSSSSPSCPAIRSRSTGKCSR